MARLTPPRTVPQWYREAIGVLQGCLDHVERARAPIVDEKLIQAVELARQLVRLEDPDAR